MTEHADYCRLSVNLAHDVANALNTIATSRNISLTEAVRRAISFYWFADDVSLRGDRLMVVTGDGHDAEFKEVVIQ